MCQDVREENETTFEFEELMRLLMQDKPEREAED
jgi:hypothetical protein